MSASVVGLTFRSASCVRQGQWVFGFRFSAFAKATADRSVFSFSVDRTYRTYATYTTYRGYPLLALAAMLAVAALLLLSQCGDWVDLHGSSSWPPAGEEGCSYQGYHHNEHNAGVVGFETVE